MYIILGGRSSTRDEAIVIIKKERIENIVCGMLSPTIILNENNNIGRDEYVMCYALLSEETMGKNIVSSVFTTLITIIAHSNSLGRKLIIFIRKNVATVLEIFMGQNLLIYSSAGREREERYDELINEDENYNISKDEYLFGYILIIALLFSITSLQGPVLGEEKAAFEEEVVFGNENILNMSDISSITSISKEKDGILQYLDELFDDEELITKDLLLEIFTSTSPTSQQLLAQLLVVLMAILSVVLFVVGITFSTIDKSKVAIGTILLYVYGTINKIEIKLLYICGINKIETILLYSCGTIIRIEVYISTGQGREDRKEYIELIDILFIISWKFIILLVDIYICYVKIIINLILGLIKTLRPGVSKTLEKEERDREGCMVLLEGNENIFIEQLFGYIYDILQCFGKLIADKLISIVGIELVPNRDRMIDVETPVRVTAGIGDIGRYEEEQEVGIPQLIEKNLQDELLKGEIILLYIMVRLLRYYLEYYVLICIVELVKIRNGYDDIIVSIYIMYVMGRISDDYTAKFILCCCMHYGFFILIGLELFFKSLSYGVIGSSMLCSFGITP